VALLKKRGMNETDAIKQAAKDFPSRRKLPRNGTQGMDIDRTSWVYAKLKAFREIRPSGFLDELTLEQLEAEAADCRRFIGEPETAPPG